MATVKFSAKLVDNITSNAGEIYHEKFKALVTKRVRTTLPLDIFNEALRGHIQHINALPKGIFRPLDYIELHQIGTHKISFPKVDVSTLGFVNPASNSFSYRGVTFTGYSTSNIFIEPHYMEQLDLNGLEVEINQFITEADELRAQQGEFIAGIEQVIANSSTLAEALKVFPPLWDLLPYEAKDRHNAETKKPQQKDKDLSNVDIQKLTTTIVAHKLMKG